MLKGASSILALILILGALPEVWADVPVAAPVDLAQANLSTDAGLVSLDFQDADIRNVLKVLAYKSGVNIVAAPDVTGVVNIELKDVPWLKALDVILSTYGYGFDRKGNIITVMSIENLKKYREDTLSLEAQEPLVSKTYTLSFAKAEDAMKIIDKLISKRGFINFDERTNAIIVRDLESNLELISNVIKSLDTITPQVLIETKVIETDLSSNENMGIEWTLGTTAEPLAISGGTRSTAFPFEQVPGSKFLPAATSAPTSTISYGTLNASGLSAAMDVLSKRSDTHTLSNPRVVTLDNEKTVINVGIQYPEATYSFNASTGGEQVTGYTFIPIGVNFEVTPHVNNPGLITLDVHPQISSLNSDASIPVPTVAGTSFPVLNNQDAQTKVMVENGNTLVIAGLVTDTTSVNKYKVPYLGDLPLVGWLFKASETSKSRKELMIFITPHIITVGNQSASAVVQ